MQYKKNEDNVTFGPMLIDNKEGKELPRKFKYIDQNYISLSM